MNEEVVIKVEDVSKKYKIYNRPQDRLKQTLFRGKRNYYSEFSALKNVSIEIHKGETVGIIGRNGSGKSTLLQIIAGTLTPSTGQVEVKGRVAALLELGSGFNPEFTGRENVYMNGAILGLSRGEIDLLFNDIVSFADIGDFIDQPVKTYSSGMAIRLAFAVQVMVPKEILIVDEALAVGDEMFQRKCYAKIEEFKQQGGTILFVSHLGGTVIQLCDRALFLDEGEPLLLGSSKTVVNIYQKFIHAPKEKKQDLRNEIKSLSVFSTQNKEVVQGKIKKLTSNSQSSPETVNLEAMYDPYLKSQSATIYESRGAKIISCEILDIQKKRVNLLVPRQTYTWRYVIEFYKSFHDVRFGMMIKTASGLELGGATSSQMGNGIFINEGSLVEMEYNFTVNLLPGSYFLNCGVSDETGTFITRAVDIFAFKVLHSEYTLGTGVIDFLVEKNITVTDRKI